MSRLSRRVERNQDRQRLGNRKKRIVRERAMVNEAVMLGAKLRIMQLQNSVAGLDYGASYYVPPTVLLLEGSKEGNANDTPLAD